MLPQPIKNFIDKFSRLPSIGPRQATRLAFKLISSGKNKIEETAKVISDLKYLKICRFCFFPHSNPDNLCDICLDKSRPQNTIMIIKKELNGQAEEIIIATNPTVYGDLQAMIIAKEFNNMAKKITRLGRGIPTGGEIEFADEETLGQALERRI